MPKLTRTHKLLFAITKFCHILPDKWLEHSLSSRKFLAEADFSLSADEFNQTFNTNLDLVLKSPLKSRLFDGKAFWITPSVVPRKKILAELIELCGGRVERIRRSRAQIEAASLTAPSTYFIITAKEDLHLVGDLLRNKKDKQRVVCNAELVLSAILRQEFEVEPYAVSVAWCTGKRRWERLKRVRDATPRDDSSSTDSDFGFAAFAAGYGEALD